MTQYASLNGNDSGRPKRVKVPTYKLKESVAGKEQATKRKAEGGSEEAERATSGAGRRTVSGTGGLGGGVVRRMGAEVSAVSTAVIWAFDGATLLIIGVLVWAAMGALMRAAVVARATVPLRPSYILGRRALR